MPGRDAKGVFPLCNQGIRYSGRVGRAEPSSADRRAKFAPRPFPFHDL